MVVRVLLLVLLVSSGPLLAIDTRIDDWRRSENVFALKRFVLQKERMDRDVGYALDSLRRIGSQEAFDTLVEILVEEPWPKAAFEVSLRLRQLPELRPEPILLQAYLATNELEERRRMLGLLLGLTSPEIYAIYSSILDDSSEDSALRHTAAEGLVAFNSREAKGRLLELYFTSTDEALRQTVAVSLARFEDPALWRQLFGPMIEFPDQPVTQAQLAALEQLRSPDAVPLLQQLWDRAQHADVKEAIVQAALNSRAEAAAPLLEEAYHSYSTGAQRQAFIALLSRFPLKAASEFYLRLLQTETDEGSAMQLISQLARHPHPDAVAVIARWMNEGSLSTKLVCVKTLGMLGRPDAAWHLAAFMKKYLKDSDTVEEGKLHPDVTRQQFVEAFFEAIEATNPLAGVAVARYVVDEGVAARDLESEIKLRIRAVKLLQRSVDPEQGTFLLEHQVHLYPNVPLRVAAIRALGTLAPPGASTALIPLLKHEIPAVRWNSARSLGLLRDSAAIDALTEAAEAQHPEVATQARYSLDQIQ